MLNLNLLSRWLLSSSSWEVASPPAAAAVAFLANCSLMLMLQMFANAVVDITLMLQMFPDADADITHQVEGRSPAAARRLFA